MTTVNVTKNVTSVDATTDPVTVTVGGAAALSAHESDADAHSGTFAPAARIFETGRWHSNRCHLSSGQALALSALYVVPFWVPKAQSFDGIGAYVTSAASAGGLLRVGVYPHDDTTGWPDGQSPVVEPAAFDSTTTGAKSVAISWTPDAGLYWLAVKSEVATCSIVASATTSHPEIGHTSIPSGVIGSYVQSGTADGGIPDPLAISSYNALTPRINLKAA